MRRFRDAILMLVVIAFLGAVFAPAPVRNNFGVLTPFFPLVVLAPFLSLVAVIVAWYEDSEGEKDD